MLQFRSIFERTNISRYGMQAEMQRRSLPTTKLLQTRTKSGIHLSHPSRKACAALRRLLVQSKHRTAASAPPQIEKLPQNGSSSLTDRPRPGRALQIFPNLWGCPYSYLVGRLPLPAKRTCCYASNRRSNRTFCFCCCCNRLFWCSLRALCLCSL